MTMTTACAQIYETVDAACAADTIAVPPGTEGNLATNIHRLRAIGAPDGMIRDAETIALTVHRLQRALARPDDPLHAKARALRIELETLSNAWLRALPMH